MVPRVYDQSMVRKCASFAFCLVLIGALGFAMAHAHPLKAAGGSTGFSTPCGPAAPAFKAASESGVVSTIDSTFAAENAGAPGRRGESPPRRSILALDSAPGAGGLPSPVASAPAS